VEWAKRVAASVPRWKAGSVSDRATTLQTFDAGAGGYAAVQAWRSLAGTRATVERIDVLKETSKTAVYRIYGVNSGGPPVVAKRRRHDAIQYERGIYERVLPLLSVSALAYHGCLPADADNSWIFLEDSRGAELDYKSPDHMAAATRWLAAAHVTGSTGVLSAASLPDRGSDHYLRHLRNANETLARHLTNPALTSDDVALLESVRELLFLLEERWPGIEAFCAVLPQTFSHGDFVQKNVHVRESCDELVVLPFDWETSGWGIPAADLTRVDFELYWSIVGDAWPQVRIEDARRMVSLGTMFRLLAAISWEAPSFRASWVKRAAMKMNLYRDRLSDAMCAWG